MTFTEAAVEVLRLVGKPLHYKKITELAIERNMLSHVGKTPEVTMSSRLATMVKRDRGEAPIIKVKPGVFGLRDFSEEQLADLSGDIDELPEAEVESDESEAAQVGETEGEAAVQAKPEPRKPLPGADVFPEEEDDDEPILGGSDDEEDEDDEAEGEGTGGEGGQSAESRSQQRRRKRKRRRGRGGDEGEDRFEPRQPTAEARAPERVEPRRDERGESRARDERSREPRDERSREERQRARNAERERERDERRERERERDERRDRERDGRRDERRDEDDGGREPGDGDLLGKDLADAVASVLGSGGPRGLPAYRVAEQLVRRGRLSGDPNSLVPTVMAAARADVARKKIANERSRFKIEAGTLTLTDFLLPQDVTRAELDVERAAERQRDRARRAFLRRLSELTPAGLAEVLATWLNAEGVVGLRAVRRPGANPGELHLAGTLRRGVEEQRLAIVVLRDVREIGRERVIEARGALHYYGNASTAWLITLGQVLSGAREEGTAPAAAPVTLFDGISLTGAMERVGVGLSVRYVAISAIDFELLDALRGPVRDVERSERGEREGERERGRGRDERGREDRGREDRGRERGERDNERGRERGREGGERERNDRERGREGGERERNAERGGERTAERGGERGAERGGERERGGNDRGRERNERDRFERDRARPAPEAGSENEEERELPETGEDELERDESPNPEGEGGESEELAAGAEGDANGESREGGRRRRRRRRRKGGRDREEGGAAGVAVAGAEGESEEGDEEREQLPEADDADAAEAADGQVPEEPTHRAHDESGWNRSEEGDDVVEPDEGDESDSDEDDDEEEEELPVLDEDSRFERDDES